MSKTISKFPKLLKAVAKALPQEALIRGDMLAEETGGMPLACALVGWSTEDLLGRSPKLVKALRAVDNAHEALVTEAYRADQEATQAAGRAGREAKAAKLEELGLEVGYGLEPNRATFFRSLVPDVCSSCNGRGIVTVGDYYMGGCAGGMDVSCSACGYQAAKAWNDADRPYYNVSDQTAHWRSTPVPAAWTQFLADIETAKAAGEAAYQAVLDASEDLPECPEAAAVSEAYQAWVEDVKAAEALCLKPGGVVRCIRKNTEKGLANGDLLAVFWAREEARHDRYSGRFLGDVTRLGCLKEDGSVVWTSSGVVAGVAVTADGHPTLKAHLDAREKAYQDKKAAEAKRVAVGRVVTRRARSGKAVMDATGTWWPLSQVTMDGDIIVDASTWIAKQKGLAV